MPIPTNPAPEGYKFAISYVRFSSKMQIGSDSERRQLENTERYCEQKKLILVKDYDFRDLGKSAYTGAHIKNKADKKGNKPGLARFMELCAAEEIPRGWALVVEAFDRLSRQDPHESMNMLREIRNRGIEIHFVMTGHVVQAKAESGEFRPDSSREDMDFVMLAFEALQAHNYSKKLAARLRATFKTKREKAMAKEKFVSETLPWWLKFEGKDDKRKIVVIPKRARILKEIYERTADGWSSLRIARKLNADGVGPWPNEEKLWLDTRIRDLIRSEAPQGVLVPTAKMRKASDYAPALDYRIEKYYPRVVSDKLAMKARFAMRENTVAINKHEHPPERPHNLFRGLLRHKGRPCRYQCRQNGKPDANGRKEWNGYYDDHFSSDPDPTTWSISANQLEPVVIAGLLELKASDLVPLSVSKVKRSIELRKEITELERQMKNLTDTLAETRGAKQFLNAKLDELGAKHDELQKQLCGTEVQENAASPKRMESLLKALSLDLRDPEVRLNTTAALYRLIERIDVADEIADLPVRGSFDDLENLDAELDCKYIEDPYPIESKRRRLFCLLITFRGAGQRLIFRTPHPFIISVRYQPNPLRAPEVEEQFRKEDEEWAALSKEEQQKRFAEFEKERERRYGIKPGVILKEGIQKKWKPKTK